MTSPGALSGRWAGTYEQYGQSHPIEADLTVDAAGALTGVMRDGVTGRSRSLFEAALETGAPPGSDERIEAALRSALPGHNTDPIQYVTRLPGDSTLAGNVAGSKVEWIKTYQGDSVYGFTVGEVELETTRVSNHQVHYRGNVDPVGQVIDGRWWIGADPTRGTRHAEGTFQLRKQV